MTIGFDARFMSVPGGLGRYCRELLIELTAQTPTNTFVIIVKQIPSDFPKRPNIRWIISDIPWYGIKEQFQLGSLMNAQHDVDLWHIPHWNIPLTLHRPFVVTFHDFIFEEFPTYDNTVLGYITYKSKWVVWRTLLAYNLRRTRAILTVSDYVRQQILRRAPEVATKISVVHVGLTRLPEPITPSFEVKQPFFLMVGNSYPHKNQALVIKMLSEHPDAITEHVYHLTHRDRFSEQLERTIATNNLSHRIHIVFDAPDTTLAWMYQTCSALIFPSLSEGFGIPPLEAFSYKKPVVAAKTSSLPEILGDHAQWFDPNSTEQLLSAILALKNDTELAADARKKHAETFTWKTAALSTQKIYESVL